MTTSLIQIATVMDPVEPPRGLRQLARRHRWRGGDPPPLVSLRDIARRHENPFTTRHRFLWYNTFLLQGFELSLCNLIILGRLLEKLDLDPRELLGLLGVTPAQVVDAMDKSKEAIVDDLDISLDALKSAFPNVVDGLVSVATFGLVDIGVGDILDEISIEDLLDKFDITLDKLLDGLKLDPLTILSTFCKETVSFLAGKSPLLLGALDAKIHIKGKPQRGLRAREIGERAAPDYEIVALCEVFEESSRSSIDKEVRSRRSSVETAMGPGDAGELASSGLLTLALDRKIVGQAEVAFEHKGDPLRDADAWSNKGVLRTVVDVSHGKIEVYSTHFMAGGGIPLDEWVLGSNPGYDDATAADVFATQRAQVDELVDFVRETHDPAHVAIVVGDFNLSAQHKGEYEALVNRMHSVGMLDLWPFHRHRNVPTQADTKKDLEGNDLPRGDTHSSKDDNMTSDVGHVCSPFDARFCNDSVTTGTTSRIDYLFVENPRPEHTFTLDVTRVRRRPFHRPHAVGGQEKFLSDHLGLDFTLIVSPKP